MRTLLARLSPAAIEREAAALPAKRGLAARLRAWVAGPSAGRWERYVQRHGDFADEGRELGDVLFGQESSRAYSRV